MKNILTVFKIGELNSTHRFCYRQMIMQMKSSKKNKEQSRLSIEKNCIIKISLYICIEIFDAVN